MKLGKSLEVIIKADEQATYKNTVNMLDEMVINDIKDYKMAEWSGEEKKLIRGIK